jgi:2,3-bisphosphoglycerate-independent phosphoglycerate mutase
VPCILIDKDYTHVKDGKLGDIGPSILKIMGINPPEIMTGEILVY